MEQQALVLGSEMGSGWGWGWLLRQGAQHCLEKVPWKLPWEQVPGAREGELQTLARKICAGGASLQLVSAGQNKESRNVHPTFHFN